MYTLSTDPVRFRPWMKSPRYKTLEEAVEAAQEKAATTDFEQFIINLNTNEAIGLVHVDGTTEDLSYP